MPAHHLTITTIQLMKWSFLARLNIPNMDILKIATINSARCVGVEKDYGSIEVGKQADLVCLEENPLENISNVRKINRVIQSGKIVVENN